MEELLLPPTEHIVLGRQIRRTKPLVLEPIFFFRDWYWYWKVEGI